MDFHLLATFFLLIGLELVLGIDNILLISILTGRLPAEQQKRGRQIGLMLAMLARLLLLLGASYLMKLTQPIIWELSWKSLILILGGGFLLFKAVKEIHHVVEIGSDDPKVSRAKPTFASIIMQIVLLDIVFSIDSVITAVGLTEALFVIYGAVVLSFALVLFFAGAISSFVHKHLPLKVLALSFLVTIGVTLVVEGIGAHVPKGYIYLPMGFALAVELLQMRLESNRRKKLKENLDLK